MSKKRHPKSAAMRATEVTVAWMATILLAMLLLFTTPLSIKPDDYIDYSKKSNPLLASVRTENNAKTEEFTDEIVSCQIPAGSSWGMRFITKQEEYTVLNIDESGTKTVPLNADEEYMLAVFHNADGLSGNYTITIDGTELLHDSDSENRTWFFEVGDITSETFKDYPYEYFEENCIWIRPDGQTHMLEIKEADN